MTILNNLSNTPAERVAVIHKEIFSYSSGAITLDNAETHEAPLILTEHGRSFPDVLDEDDLPTKYLPEPTGDGNPMYIANTKKLRFVFNFNVAPNQGYDQQLLAEFYELTEGIWTLEAATKTREEWISASPSIIDHHVSENGLIVVITNKSAEQIGGVYHISGADK